MNILLDQRESNQKTPTQAKPQVKSYVYVLSFIIGLVSLVIFLRGPKTAYEIPSVDMFPYFQRQANAHFAENDFYTNATAKPNPRQIFGTIITTTSKTLRINWYTTIFALRILLTIFLPILYFLILFESLKRHILDEDKQYAGAIIIFAFILLVLTRASSLFSLGVWSPLSLTATAEELSLFIGLLGILFLRLHQRTPAIVAYGLQFLSTLLHPPVGIFVFVLDYIFFFKESGLISYISRLIFGVFVPGVLLLALFPSHTHLSSADFVLHYVRENHDYHYLPSQIFHGLRIFTFLGISGALLMLGLYNFWRKNTPLGKKIILALGAYAGALLFQYLFVELIPTKIWAEVGPERFTMFGFWFVTFSLAATVASYIPRNIVPSSFEIRHSKRAHNIALGFMLIALFMFGMKNLDDPFARIKRDNGELGKFIEHTATSSVFALPPTASLNTEILPVFHRPTFHGAGFPFREDDFIENDLRNELLFGSAADLRDYPEKNMIEKREVYYRNNSPEDFARAANKRRIDYVVLEKDYTSKFAAIRPEFCDTRFCIYSMNAITTQNNAKK